MGFVADQPELGSLAPTLENPNPYAPHGFVPDAPEETAAERMKRHSDILSKAPTLAASAKRTANLALDTAGGLVGQVAGGVTGVANDVIGADNATTERRVKAAEGIFNNPDPNSDVSAAGHAIGESAPIQAVGAGLHAADTGIRHVVGGDTADALERVAGHVVNALPVIGKLAGPAVEAAGAGATDLARLRAGMSVADRAAAAKADTARNTAGPISTTPGTPQIATPAVTAPDDMLRKAGYRISPSLVKDMTGAVSKPSQLARTGEAAGGSIASDNIVFNRKISNGWAASDIGLPRDAILTDENIAKATKPAQAGYDQVKAALPDRVPVSEATRTALAGVGADMAPGYELTPEVVRANNIFSTDSFNAENLMKSIRAVKAHGSKNLLSDDPVKNDIGRAQLAQARALQSELDSRVATKAPALLGTYQSARRLFAKIYTVEDAKYGKGFNIDPQAVMKLADKNEGIDGGLKIIADAATHAPEEVRLKTSGSSSGLGDVAVGSASLGSAATMLGYGHPMAAALTATGAILRPGVRAALRHTRGETPAAALDSSPEGPLGNYFGRDDSGFAPQPSSLTLKPPPGTVAEPHQPSLLRSGETVPVAEQGGLPPPGGLKPPPGTAFEPHQHDLLKTGGGTTDTRSLADQLSGDLSLAPSQPRLAPSATHADLPGVMSANVEKAGGMKVLPNVQVSPFAERHIMPGSTVLLDGTTAAPKNYIALTPQEGGALRITSAYSDPALSGTGRGQRQLVAAAEHAENLHQPLESDVTVTVSQLRAYEAAKAKGKLDFDYANPAAVTKALKGGNPLTVVSGKGAPVVTNIRTPDSLGAALGGKP